MYMIIPDVLDQQLLDTIRQQLGDASFIDGSQSAGRDAAKVKSNEELDAKGRLAHQLNGQVMRTLYDHPGFQAAAMPLRLSSAYFSRYRKGMSYGRHVDDAVMGQAGSQYRTDVSITIFLSSPHEYQGGELVIESEEGEQSFKAPAGHALIYPSGSLHRVNEVTDGERLAAVAWAQSMVRDPQHRAMLYDLYIVKETLQQVNPDAEATARARRAYVNLFRQWAEL